jgi:hypothetical protein
MLPTQLSPISLLRNTMVCGTLFSGGLRISSQEAGGYENVLALSGAHTRGEILRPLGGSISQTIVFPYKEIRGILCIRNIKGIVSRD